MKLFFLYVRNKLLSASFRFMGRLQCLCRAATVLSRPPLLSGQAKARQMMALKITSVPTINIIEPFAEGKEPVYALADETQTYFEIGQRLKSALSVAPLAPEKKAPHPLKKALQWMRANSIILVNAGSLVGTTVVTSLLGFVYWWLAARAFPPAVVGFASAAISAMTLLGTFALLGLGTLLLGELPQQRGREASLISTAVLLVGGVGGLLGLVFAVAAPHISADFRVLGASIGNCMLFALGVSLTAI